MPRTKNIVALDCGNSSYRIVLGRYDGERITTEVIDQKPNHMIQIGDYFYWDFLMIFHEFKQSLKKVASMVDQIDSVGVCTWGIDFALFEKNGNMLSNPLSYRNTIGEEHLSKLNEDQKKSLFNQTGILCDRINSIYMLMGIKEKMPEIYATTDKVLMVPDILNYMLTGVMVNEPSELSTTQLLDVSIQQVNPTVCKQFDVPYNWFSKIGVHGEIIGNIRNSILSELNIGYDIPVVCVPSHDTASAVVAIPAKEKDFAFISSGTWSLIGTELDSPIINEEVRNNNLTNELGAFGKITLLKNSAGMFLVQRIRKELEQVLNRELSWSEIDRMADEYMDESPLFNINDGRFFNPTNMIDEIWRYLKETNQVGDALNYNAIIKSVYVSIACCYAQTIAQIEGITGKIFESIYIVGGGSRNKAINKLTSMLTGKKVIACDKESTSLGNIGVQLKYFDSDLDIFSIRDVIGNSIETVEYNESSQPNDLVNRYIELCNH